MTHILIYRILNIYTQWKLLAFNKLALTKGQSDTLHVLCYIGIMVHLINLTGFRILSTWLDFESLGYLCAHLWEHCSNWAGKTHLEFRWHHPIGWAHKLNTTKRVSPGLTLISLCFLNRLMVTSCPMLLLLWASLPWQTVSPQTVSQNTPFFSQVTFA